MVILAGGGWGMLQAAKIEECYRQMRYLKTDFSDQKRDPLFQTGASGSVSACRSEAQEPYKMWLLCARG